MAVTAHTYTMLAKSLSDKLCDLDSDALKVMLLSAYTVGGTQDTAQFVTDVLAVGTQVASGGGYTTGGQALASVQYTRSGHVFTLDCADPLWSPATFSASHALFYDSTPGSNATNPVICYWDFGGTQTVAGVPFGLTIDPTGLLTLTGS